jgi:hypothetical protein
LIAIADAMPGIRQAGDPVRLRSGWINGLKGSRSATHAEPASADLPRCGRVMDNAFRSAADTAVARPSIAIYLRSMDVQAHQDVAAATAVHTELGQPYEGALAEGLVQRISSEIDKQVDARLAQRGIQPGQIAWSNVAMGLGSVGLGIGATAVTLSSLWNTAVAPKASVDLGAFKASVMTTTSSVSTAQVALIVLIWVVIAVVNIAYARLRPGRR